jgi:hypothetical protein
VKLETVEEREYKGVGKLYTINISKDRNRNHLVKQALCTQVS